MLPTWARLGAKRSVRQPGLSWVGLPPLSCSSPSSRPLANHGPRSTSPRSQGEPDRGRTCRAHRTSRAVGPNRARSLGAKWRAWEPSRPVSTSVEPPVCVCTGRQKAHAADRHAVPQRLRHSGWHGPCDPNTVRRLASDRTNDPASRRQSVNSSSIGQPERRVPFMSVLTIAAECSDGLGDAPAPNRPASGRARDRPHQSATKRQAPGGRQRSPSSSLVAMLRWLRRPHPGRRLCLSSRAVRRVCSVLPSSRLPP